MRRIGSIHTDSRRCIASKIFSYWALGRERNCLSEMTPNSPGEKQQCLISMRCRYDAGDKVFVCRLPDSSRPEFYLHPAVVRRNDTSAKSINEWTGEKTLRYPLINITRVKQSMYVCT